MLKSFLRFSYWKWKADHVEDVGFQWNWKSEIKWCSAGLKRNINIYVWMKYCRGDALLALREKPILWLRSISNNAIIVNFNPANMIIYANTILSHGTFRLGVLRNFPSCCTCKRGDLKCVLKVYQSQLLLTLKIGREKIITFCPSLW